MRERRAAGDGEIIALGQKARRNFFRRKIFDRARDLMRPMARAIDHGAAGDGVAALRPHFIAAGARDDAGHFGLESETRAKNLGVALQRQHQGVAVDDPGRGRQQRGDAFDLGLKPAGALAVERDKIVHAIGDSLPMQGFKLGKLFFVGRDDEFSQAPGRNAALGAISVKQLAPLDASRALKLPCG